MEPVDIAVSFKSSPFEFENLERSGMELWAVRIPADVSMVVYPLTAGETFSIEFAEALVWREWESEHQEWRVCPRPGG